MFQLYDRTPCVPVSNAFHTTPNKMFRSLSVDPSRCDAAPTSADVLMSCVLYTFAVFVVSLPIKLSLRIYQERLTFVDRTDDVRYHVSSSCMEIVEVTEQYCYTMIIGMILKLGLPGETAAVMSLKTICNLLTKLTTNSCSYYVFRTNLVFVVYHAGPSASTVLNGLRDSIRAYRRRGETQTGDNDGWRALRRDLYRGVIVSRSIAVLIASSYISNRCTLALWSANVLNTKTTFLETRCPSRRFKRADTLSAAAGEAVITFMYLALQVGLRKACRCFRMSKNLLTSSALMYINLTAFRHTGVLMNPTYATATLYGCPGRIDRDHFVVFWIGPIVGALLFKDVAETIQTLYTRSAYWLRRLVVV